MMAENLAIFAPSNFIVKLLFFFFKDLFIYLFVRERERSESEHKQTEWQAEGEAGSLPSKEPDVGLDPRTLGS